MYTQQELKQQVAQAAVQYVLPYLQPDTILGVGTGSTVDLFIHALAPHADRFKGAASSSNRSTQLMQQLGIDVKDLNEIESMDWYVDGADEIDLQLNMTKGGGGALTREKIVASVAQRFLCIADDSKLVQQLGAFALPVEVIPMARAAVARELAKLGGRPHLREGFITDNGGLILDVEGLDIRDPAQLESHINNIPGVVCCGLFALKPATVALLAGQAGIQRLLSSAS
ncbi:ribose-5-phosphate isomerase RpiA [Alcaligenes endophyticus]|uniref:Ribose-5-phosphate isomerase A n=1 Tax=Alcaligenes endophyticus TaxID=1929088 RepID=A0ABT8ENC2_9BURK|nr:ribose-5-phosphate isomerase RpiA [Alcaligenes endophyticus]MCX5591308.1 ribose-5-phosphate isomerase RpiA [Alcaligenes endophyticus]MDN4122811.1 ribose-5-phosphate isomerase RpiA [Alcaligenes endophyticus]